MEYSLYLTFCLSKRDIDRNECAIFNHLAVTNIYLLTSSYLSLQLETSNYCLYLGKEDDIDYEWIPKSALLSTPGSGSKTSPRQRKGKKAASAGSESD